MATASKSDDQGKGGARAVSAAVVGTALETFDFASFSFFSVIIAKLFFPAHDDLTSLLLVGATFGVSFVIRPLGGIVFGIYGDRVGRKKSLSLSLILMATGIGVVGFAPTYQQMGIGATLMLITGRLIQGFAQGGEVGAAATFITEHAPPHRRAFYASFIQLSIGLAIVAGALVGALINAELTPQEIESWGWRIPFILGLVIGPVGWYIRRSSKETPTFEKNEISSTPLREVLRVFPRETLASVSLVVLWTVCTYILIYYMPTYAVKTLGMTAADGFWAGIVGGALITVLSPLFGWLADVYGRRVFLVVSSLLIGLLAFPMFIYIEGRATLHALIVFQIVFGILISSYTAPILAVFAEMFPSRVRSTGLTLAYNIAVTIFGGFASFIVTLLIATTGSRIAPAGYVAAAALISLCGALLYPKKTHQF